MIAYEPYEPWDLAHPPIPERSHLYALDPIGRGTADVESLTGYIARLATAHCLRTRSLVRYEILPLLGRRCLLKPVNGSLSAFWRKDTRGINGIGPYAHEWTQVVGQLTRRQDLHVLTMLPWGDVLARRGLLRPTRAWCPACYEERRAVGREPYDLLLWALRIVTVCAHHRQPLQDRCPHPGCRSTQSVLAPLSRPGYCARCLRWLGTPAAGRERVDTAVAHDHSGLPVSLWRARLVGELLAAAPTLGERPARRHIAEALTAAIETAAGGNVTAFARSLRLDSCTVWQWANNVNLPSLDLLVRVCASQGVSLLHVLTGQPGEVDAAGITPPDAAPRRPSLPRVARANDRLRRALEAALDEDPPPSVRAVARHLGFRAAASLYDRFPDLCRALAERGRAYRQERHALWQERLHDEVRQATFALYHQGIYPASVRVPPLLSHPGYFRHPVAMAAWRETMQELDVARSKVRRECLEMEKTR